MRVSEEKSLIPVCEPHDYGSAGLDFDSGSRWAALNALGIVIMFGALTGNSTLTVNQGATEDAKTTPIGFKYRISAGVFKAADADQFGDPIAVASTGLVLVAGTFAHKQIVIEIDADTSLEGEQWLTVSLDNVATVLNVSSLGIGYTRQPGHLIPSQL